MTTLQAMADGLPNRKEYAPYDTFPAFEQGFADYTHGKPNASFANGVDEQAYDRGREYAMRLQNWTRTTNGG